MSVQPELLENLSPSELTAAVLGQSGEACITCSFQAEDMAVLHMALQIKPDIPVLFLETGYHFPETVAYRDEMTRAWNLNLINLAAVKTVAEQEAEFGILNQSEPTRCCQLRKVEPLMAGLQPYDVWLTGLRREQSPTRANLKVAEWHILPTGKKILKTSPAAAWKTKEVWDYCKQHNIPFLSLYDQGYTSIGCAPCTSLPEDPENARSGRWGGRKLECGIHTFSAKG